MSENDGYNLNIYSCKYKTYAQEDALPCAEGVSMGIPLSNLIDNIGTAVQNANAMLEQRAVAAYLGQGYDSIDASFFLTVRAGRCKTSFCC